jgi:hypothetical protein
MGWCRLRPPAPSNRGGIGDATVGEAARVLRDCAPSATSGVDVRPLNFPVRHPRVVRALCGLHGLRVAIGLSAGFICGCVELPGIYYQVMFNDRPSESDCVNLTDALTTKLKLELRPSPYQCAVTLDNDGGNPPQNVVIFAYFRQRYIPVEIDELHSGTPTASSLSTQQFAQHSK